MRAIINTDYMICGTRQHIIDGGEILHDGDTIIIRGKEVVLEYKKFVTEAETVFDTKKNEDETVHFIRYISFHGRVR